MRFADLPAHQRAWIEANANAALPDYCPVCDMPLADAEAGDCGSDPYEEPDAWESDNCLSASVWMRGRYRQSMHPDADLMTLDEYINRPKGATPALSAPGVDRREGVSDLARAWLEEIAADPVALGRLRELVAIEADATEPSGSAYTTATLAAAEVGRSARSIRAEINRGDLGAEKSAAVGM